MFFSVALATFRPVLVPKAKRPARIISITARGCALRGEGEMSEPTDLPENLRKQIDDALARGDADRLPPEPPPRPRRPARRPPRSLPDPRPRNPQQLLLISALIALA